MIDRAQDEDPVQGDRRETELGCRSAERTS